MNKSSGIGVLGDPNYPRSVMDQMMQKQYSPACPVENYSDPRTPFDDAMNKYYASCEKYCPPPARLSDNPYNPLSYNVKTVPLQ